MAGKPFNLQDHFLNGARRARLSVSIFVTKGVKLQGKISGFDNFSLMLQRDGKGQLVYKHAIATIMPAGELDAVDFPKPELGPKSSMQDEFLAAAATERTAVTVYLVNGVMLQGEIAGFDLFCVLLSRGRLSQLIYKHAISAIEPDTALPTGRDGDGVTSDPEEGS